MSVISVQFHSKLIQEYVTSANNNTYPATEAYIVTDDTVATVTAPGYLTSIAKNANYVFFDGQIALVYTVDSGADGTPGSTWFKVKVSGATVSLEAHQGSVVGSATDGNLVEFSGTKGSIADSGVNASNVLVSSLTSPDVNCNLVCFDVTIDSTTLASGGTVTLYAGSGTKQYKIRSLFINSGGLNFSGGDRLLSITDGTAAYSVVPAATLQTLVNAGWGSSDLPYPASVAIKRSTDAGSDIYAEYSGGTTDYVSGSVVISGILERVA